MKTATPALRLLALFLLLVYSVSSVPVIPAAVSALAALEGSHQVYVQESASGIRLLLHHRIGRSTPRIGDHQGLAGKAAVVLCSLNPEGDHCLCSSLAPEAAVLEEKQHKGAALTAKAQCAVDKLATEALLTSVKSLVWISMANRHAADPVHEIPDMRSQLESVQMLI